MAHTYSALADRFGVSRGAIQNWEKRGLKRDWTLQQIDEWREMHSAGRVVIPKLQEVQTAKPAETAQPKAAGQVILEGLNFQETRTIKLRKEIERLSIIIGREKGELVPAVEMRETATRVVSVWCSELDALVGDLPGQLAGLNESDIQPKLKARIELLKANARQGFAGL